MSVICCKFLLKLAQRTEIFLNLSHASTLSIWSKEIQAKTEEWATQTSTVLWHFDHNHLARVIVLWQMQQFLCYGTVFALFYFEFKDNFRVQAPGGLYLEGRFTGGFFALRVWGAYIIFGGAFYFEFKDNFRVQAPGGLYLEGRFTGGFFALRVWGAYIIFGGAYHIFGTLRYMKKIKPSSPKSMMEKWGVLAFVRLHPWFRNDGKFAPQSTLFCPRLRL